MDSVIAAVVGWLFEFGLPLLTVALVGAVGFYVGRWSGKREQARVNVLDMTRMAALLRPVRVVAVAKVRTPIASLPQQRGGEQ